MKKSLIFALYFLVSFTILAQEKIPFIDYDDIYKQVSEADDNEKIIEFLNQINKNDSTYCSVLVSKSYYLLNSEKYEKAIAVTDEGIGLNCYDSNLSFYINKGLAHAYLDKYEEALKIYNEGLKTFPKYYLLWHNKAAALEKLNRIEEAIEAYQNAILFKPTYSKPHLQLGNLCYKQALFSQALMCYNMYLLLSFDKEGAFNTLKSLNNLVAEKNENEANPDIQISEDDKAFEDIDLILSNKIALNKNYETGNKINISLTKQNHALLSQLEDFEGNNGFWDQKYVPLFKWIQENNLFDNFTYTLSYSIQNEKYTKIIKQKEKEIVSFIELFYDKWQDILKDNKTIFDNKKQDVVYNYYNGYTEAIGEMKDNISIGNWQFYNKNGQLSSYGEYNEKGEEIGKWTWLYLNGKIKETAVYENGVLNGENFQYHKNGKPYIVANYSKGKLNGEYKYYNDKGALIQKKYYKNGELDGLYKSFFPVGEDLIEFYIPYKNGLIDNLALEYHANGNIYAEMSFTNGKREGVEKKYFFNKKISSEINYKNGEFNGNYQSYYSNGKTYEIGQSLDNFYNGPWKTFYRDGTLQSDFIYDKGYIDGEYKYFDTDGKLYYDYLYRKGEIIEFRYYDKQGNILSEGRKKGGEFQFTGHHPNGNILSKGLYDIKGGKEGLWEFFSKNAVLTSKGNYSDGEINGEYINYYNNGKIESKSNYDNGSLSGYYVYYYKNGQLNRQGWNKDGLALGEWRSYYVDGTLKIINFYHKDKLHGTQKFYSVDGKLEHTSKYEFGELISEVYYDYTGNILGNINYKSEENNFTIEYKHKNKKTSSKTEYVNGIKHGKYIGYDFYGNIALEGNYLNGSQDGEWTWYYENGKIKSTRNYQNGSLNGEGVDYFEDGSVQATLFYKNDKANGSWITYHENGKKSRITEYNNDVVHGKRIFYDNSEKLQLIRFYDYGTLIGYSYLDKDSNELPMIPLKNETGKIKSYFDNGNVARELEYKNGDLVNIYNEYYYSGQLENTMHFVDNEYHGTDLEYYPNGKLRIESQYQMGILQGLTKKYYENGNIKEEINYRNGKKTGEANYYNQNSKLTKKVFYFNGDIYKSETY
ncbi:hypothetical protein Q4Q39_11905 [Flavivirga amylovorans]|uniref:Tetratricopeptide repeat protein n=1 Tax=Flavivirga amylovorans TaxID=870486 RepID=A0ABT8X2C6_9FLAO|nr:hypothetical protein [Flavivirga amylovorans]MDO5988110.1 hypothetical protein [Flavivirga amylovorans]